MRWLGMSISETGREKGVDFSLRARAGGVGMLDSWAFSFVIVGRGVILSGLK